MPSLQQLRYLVAVSDHLNFRRAAEQCHVTQPTLSAQLSELEKRLGGVVLVERSRSVVLMTELGQAVAVRARNMLRELDEIQALAKMHEETLSGTLKVGVVHSLGSYLLPLLLPDLRRSHPMLRFYTREGLADVLLDQLEAGALDVLFFPLPHSRSHLTDLPLFREPLFVVTPESHPIGSRESVAPDELKDEVILSLEPGHRLYDQTRDICKKFGARLSHEYEGTSLDTIRQMVAMGMGISLMPALYVQSEVEPQTEVTATPLTEITPSRTIGMVWRTSTVRGVEYRALGGVIRDILAVRAPVLRLIHADAR